MVSGLLVTTGQKEKKRKTKSSSFSLYQSPILQFDYLVLKTLILNAPSVERKADTY